MNSATWKMMDMPPDNVGPAEKEKVIVTVLNVKFSTLKKWWKAVWRRLI